MLLASFIELCIAKTPMRHIEEPVSEIR